MNMDRNTVSRSHASATPGSWRGECRFRVLPGVHRVLLIAKRHSVGRPGNVLLEAKGALGRGLSAGIRRSWMCAQHIRGVGALT
jgi:hypothetical protein